MKVVATICSREKNSDPKPLQARERYVGEHVKHAQIVANQLERPLYILSGKYGFIAGDNFIPNYDYLLENENDTLTKLVVTQIIEAEITEVDFYYKNNSGWIPYIQTLQKACKLESIKLRGHEI